jgi:hypothetical protein
VDILALDAAVRDPRAAVVIEGLAVVDGQQVSAGVVGLDDAGEAFPVLGGLAEQQIPVPGAAQGTMEA